MRTGRGLCALRMLQNRGMGEPATGEVEVLLNSEAGSRESPVSLVLVPVKPFSDGPALSFIKILPL
jgi:hypothetical protein